MKLKLLEEKRILKRDDCSCGNVLNWVENEKGEFLEIGSGILERASLKKNDYCCLRCGRSITFE
jgi:hypothetical protein